MTIFPGPASPSSGPEEEAGRAASGLPGWPGGGSPDCSGPGGGFPRGHRPCTPQCSHGSREHCQWRMGIPGHLRGSVTGGDDHWECPWEVAACVLSRRISSSHTSNHERAALSAPGHCARDSPVTAGEAGSCVQGVSVQGLCVSLSPAKATWGHWEEPRGEGHRRGSSKAPPWGFWGLWCGGLGRAPPALVFCVLGQAGHLS